MMPGQRRPLCRRTRRARRLRPGVRRAADERHASSSPRTCTSRASEVQYSGVITSAKGWKARRRTRSCYRLAGLRAGEGEGRHRRARRREADCGRIRRWLGTTMDLRIDANEAWPPAEAAERIRELEPFGITSVEQPVRHEDVACLADGPQAGQDADHARRVAVRRGRRRAGGARTGGATCSTCGCRSAAGSSRRLRLAQLAKRHGLGYQLGCQVGETAILSAAGRHFATSVDGHPLPRRVLRPAPRLGIAGDGGPHVRPRRVGADAGRQRARGDASTRPGWTG